MIFFFSTLKLAKICYNKISSDKKVVVFMDYEFSSQEELFTRVRPALQAKEIELQRLGYSYIKDIDIWNYLIEVKWKTSKNLMLSDIVNDIMHINEKKIDEYLKGKITRSRRTKEI